MRAAEIKTFQKEILDYYRLNKRAMAWRDISNPYKIFISEMMLQQTQVERVKVKYAEFIKRFPNIKSVADASSKELLILWQGLGYNRRALFIKKACEKIVTDYKGIFPKDYLTMQTLPGIGPGTAGAICAFAYNTNVFYIETNICTVLLYFFFKNEEKVSDKLLLETLEKVTPTDIEPRDWYYALYDYGTHLKKTLGKKKTELHKKSKHYNKQSKFEGSFRQKRAKVLRMMLNGEKITGIEKDELKVVLASLKKDGLI
jgi:A/G-specific adenine glycosylase